MWGMPSYRIYRLKEHQRQRFRWAPHTSGATSVKPRDYEQAGCIEAASAYAAWTALQDTEEPLKIGDLLEVEEGPLHICKYVGFEEARWVLPEVKSGLEAAPPAVGGPADAPGLSEPPARA
jgi:hypothetical protein